MLSTSGQTADPAATAPMPPAAAALPPRRPRWAAAVALVLLVALPLPAQFLQHSGRLVAESGRGIRYRLIGFSPIYQRNAPATEFERKALEMLRRQPDHPVTGVVSSGKKQYFQAIYADRAVSSACITCHNSHPLSPKQDFKLNEVMGGIAVTIPLE